MDDLSQKIDSLLNSPEGMQKIQAAMAALGQSAPSTGADAAQPPPTAESSGDVNLLTQLLGGLGGSSVPEPPKAAEPSSASLPDLSKIMQLMPLLSSLNKEDENTTLLKALRPYLHGEREKRVDDAIQMMKVMKLVPLLTDQKKLP